MGRQRRYTPKQIISKLHEAEVLLSQGRTVGEAARQLGVSEQTYYRWPKSNLMDGPLKGDRSIGA